MQVRREIRRRFARLLKSFTDENGDAIYKQRVREMVTSEYLPACCWGRCRWPSLYGRRALVLHAGKVAPPAAGGREQAGATPSVCYRECLQSACSSAFHSAWQRT